MYIGKVCKNQLNYCTKNQIIKSFKINRFFTFLFNFDILDNNSILRFLNKIIDLKEFNFEYQISNGIIKQTTTKGRSIKSNHLLKINFASNRKFPESLKLQPQVKYFQNFINQSHLTASLISKHPQG